MLANLISGAPSVEPVGSLSSVVQPPAGKKLSLVGALNALRRGEIPRPADNALSAALDDFAVVAPSVRRPAPADISRELEEQRRQDETDRIEMLAHVHRKRAEAINHDAERRHRVTQRLDQVEAQLLKEATNGRR